MSRKRSPIAREVEPPGADDLKLINGIGPAVETRLHRVGIFTFAQLAALSPADLAAAVADLTGLTAERISKQDWIGQARELAQQRALPEPEEDAETLRDVQNDGMITSESQRDAQPLAGIEEDEVIAVEPAPPDVSKSGPAGTLRLNDMEIVLGESSGRHCMLASGQPFTMRLALDFTDVLVPIEEPLHYTAIISGKPLGSSIRQVVGEGQGSIKAAGRVIVNLDCRTPSPGTYILEAAVTIAQPTPESADLTALNKGNLLHVH